MDFKQYECVWLSDCERYHIELRGASEPYYVASEYDRGRIGNIVEMFNGTLDAAKAACEAHAAKGDGT